MNSKTVLSLTWAVVRGLPHLLLLEILHAAHQRQVEPNPKAVLEEKRRTAAVQLTLGDDGDAVAQQVSLVHVVSAQDHSPSCDRVRQRHQIYIETTILKITTVHFTLELGK